MSPARFHCATLLLPNHAKKNLPRPGVEPESLWPQHNVLTVRPPKHTFFIAPFFTELLGLVTRRNTGPHTVVRLVAKYDGSEESLERKSVERDQ